MHGVKGQPMLAPPLQLWSSPHFTYLEPHPFIHPFHAFQFLLENYFNFNCLFRSVPAASRDVFSQNSQLQQQDGSVVLWCHARFPLLFFPTPLCQVLVVCVASRAPPLPPRSAATPSCIQFIYQIYNLRLYISLKILSVLSD